MELRETILAEHSKVQTNAIVKWVGNSQERFDALFHLFLTDEYRVVQRAAWLLSYCVIEHPQLIQKHFKDLVANLHTPNLSGAVKRNTLRLLQHVSIPERFHGEIMNLCFDYIASPVEAVAVKAFALTILQKIAQFYPEIKDEVKIIIEDRWEVESPAFKSRAKKFLAAFNP
ncbi:MAG TPA: hypothetical protein VKA92_14530 [Segetibacter sp.]|nr:hypothetical protein [Segetibacter sp.]